MNYSRSTEEQHFFTLQHYPC